MTTRVTRPPEGGHYVDTDGRIAAAFGRLRSGKTPGLVTYVTAGDPDLRRTEGILRALDRAGADVLEIGVPFSDPLADGPVIQRATERALASGTTLSKGALRGSGAGGGGGRCPRPRSPDRGGRRVPGHARLTAD
jgi:hypothetical protein